MIGPCWRFAPARATRDPLGYASAFAPVQASFDRLLTGLTGGTVPRTASGDGNMQNILGNSYYSDDIPYFLDTDLFDEEVLLHAISSDSFLDDIDDFIPY